jgi:hypothetical protein
MNTLLTALTVVAVGALQQSDYRAAQVQVPLHEVGEASTIVQGRVVRVEAELARDIASPDATGDLVLQIRVSTFDMRGLPPIIFLGAQVISIDRQVWRPSMLIYPAVNAVTLDYVSDAGPQWPVGQWTRIVVDIRSDNSRLTRVTIPETIGEF